MLTEQPLERTAAEAAAEAAAETAEAPEALPQALPQATHHRQHPRHAPSRTARLRGLWLKMHRWIGLTAGLLFVLIGLTGSVLVFDHAIDEWLNPDVLLTTGTGSPRPIEEIVAAAEQAFPDHASDPSHASHAHSVTSPRVANGVWTVWFASGAEEALRFTAVHVDPYTAAVTGQRVWGEDLLSWIYRLHFRLLAGEVGAAIVGISGIVLMVSILSGICLWWPLWKNSWRAAFAIRGGSRFNYDLHKTVGIISTALLMIIAFTGVYMEFPDWVKPAVTLVSEETPEPTGLKSDTTVSTQSITPDQAVAIAEQRFPNATFCHFHPPVDLEGVYEVALLQPGEIQSSFGRTQVYVDRYTGNVLAVRNPEDFTAADAFFAWQFPLHNGEAFGLAGRWIVFFSGLTPAILYVSGFAVWWRKRKSKRRQQLRRRDEPMLPVTNASTESTELASLTAGPLVAGIATASSEQPS